MSGQAERELGPAFIVIQCTSSLFVSLSPPYVVSSAYGHDVYSMTLHHIFVSESLIVSNTLATLIYHIQVY